MTATRRLAAILAADMAGYSRLMGRMRKARLNVWPMNLFGHNRKTLSRQSGDCAGRISGIDQERVLGVGHPILPSHPPSRIALKGE